MRRGLFGHALLHPLGPIDEGALAARIAERIGEWLLRMLCEGHRQGAVVPLHSPDLWHGPSHLLVLGEPAPAGEVPTVVVGPTRMLAIALQTPVARCAVVLSEPLAQAIIHWSSIRAEFHAVASGVREGELAARHESLHPPES